MLYRWVFRLQQRSALSAQGERFRPDIPVIVVGNITLGGTGKTPLTLALLEVLKKLDMYPGVISRGYGGQPPQLPYVVSTSDNPVYAGDEPLLIRRHSGCPVVVDPDRRRALRHLIQQFNCDVVVSDDGLQHHRLPRDLEIVVIDGQRRLGNGWCLPAGPLREPVSRLATVDLIISNGNRIPEAPYLMTLKPLKFVKTDGSDCRSLEFFRGQAVNAIAGIGNPQRFFQQLRELGMSPICHEFPDHYRYRHHDLAFEQPLPLVMTAKDAVKCAHLNLSDGWYLQVEAELDGVFVDRFKTCLYEIQSASEN